MSGLRLSVLVDNNTLIDHYFTGEPAVSYFIETEETTVLFDVGYSDAFLHNASKLGIDVTTADRLVISHGHIDHTGGLDALLKECTERRLSNRLEKGPRVLLHPHALIPKYLDKNTTIGLNLSEAVLRAQLDVQTSTEPVWLSERLVFLGQIKREIAFEQPSPMGFRAGDEPDELIPDELLDDTALAYVGKEGLYVITGCSHAGICNIIAQARRVTDVDKVADVIGGFHLLDPSRKRLDGTATYFKKLSLQKLHACHCTDLRSRIALSQTAPLEEVGSGLVLELD